MQAPMMRLRTSRRRKRRLQVQSSSRHRVLVLSHPLVPLLVRVGEVQWHEACLPSWPRRQHRRRSKSRLTQLFFLFFCNHVCGMSRALAFDANAFMRPKGHVQFCRAFTSVCACAAFLVVLLLPSAHNFLHDFECAMPRALKGKKNLFRRTNFVTTGVTQNQICEIELLEWQVLMGF